MSSKLPVSWDAGPLQEFDSVALGLSQGCVRNGSVLSFEYRSFQVDVNTVQPDVFDLSIITPTGDVGMVLGLLAKRAGLKLSGENGLFIRHQCRYVTWQQATPAPVKRQGCETRQ
ncbi:hypothetical protein WJX72_011583 [[Myrmecia] bisecta]|uniref:Uncharacterized protein n=1 Tax=[Myrmecia] bisecta TaxID=41462 RepID=A0AAW1RAD7_9CHLO